MTKLVRVRFAPSPTGLLHLGSVRIALFNFIFARQNQGSFILRIEDTDAERNFDVGAKIILEDLAWLGLDFDEGPVKQGPYAPYFQSERLAIYKEKLLLLEKNESIYRCFCSADILEKKRLRQIALKQPPRYDRTCLQLSTNEVELKLEQNTPFIWRFKLPEQQEIVISDLVRGSINFDLANFADFAVTRQDGSFTFLFANAVDDVTMNVTHVLRGEDHISNTPCQVALYQALGGTTPTFWHMPVICNTEGKKLSKRDFGFSLRDLKNGGYLPEAILNYLAIIGASFTQEIMDLATIIKSIDFGKLHATSAIRYDVEKLMWVNHQWLAKLAIKQLAELGLPFLEKQFPQVNNLNQELLFKLIALVQPELKTLHDLPATLGFYFVAPHVTQETLAELASQEIIDSCLMIFKENIEYVNDAEIFYKKVSEGAKEKTLPLKAVWQLLRTLLTGSSHGLGIKELLNILGPEESKKRITRVL